MFRTLFLVGALLSPLQAIAGVRVAVVEFTNAADDHGLDALGKGLQSMVTTDLSGVKSLQLVERSRLAEIQKELALSADGWVKASTASKVGELSGASHLLGGSFTVVGDTMRLDAQMFEVETGRVIIAESLVGEKAAFFELEKDLVNLLIKTLELELSPKERATIRRIHTADFEAFEEFSAGIELFDARKYDEALASIKDAIKADEDFKLAKMTLDSYTALVAKMRLRAAALDTKKATEDRLKDLSRVSEGFQVIEKLIEKSSSVSQRTRLTALYTLACIYSS